MKHKIYLLLFVVGIASCATSHNTPTNPTPNEFNEPNTTKIFVDQNGDFYPSNWENTYGTPPKRGKESAFSLRTLEEQNSLPPLLKNFETNFLNDLQQRFKSKKRIFILIHGYNKKEESADRNYEQIKNLISHNSDDDEFIEFYWDGLSSNNPVGVFNVWFNAAGYSSLAGEFGLRDILNVIENKEVILISHSRGANVILSSLSSPPYDPDFIEDTKEFHNLEIPNLTPLIEQNNQIYIIMLAPAIGFVDFQTPDKKGYRTFSPQVKSIHITINKHDHVLKKYFRPLSRKLNPTDLGYNKNVFNFLSYKYSLLKATELSMRSHDFARYISHPKFKQVLNANGITTTNIEKTIF